MVRRALLITAALAGLSGCTWGYDDYGHRPGWGGYGPYGPPPPAYRGREWAGPRAPYAGDLSGPGLETLDDWLKDTPEGRAVVTLGFQDAANGVVSEDVAHRANVWFRRYADHDRNMEITDEEIRTALVTAAGRYVRRR